MKPDKITISLGMLITFVTFSWISSCTHQPDPNSFDKICYKDVNAIITGKCYLPSTNLNPQACHDGFGEGPDLSTPATVLKQVVPGNADASALYKAIIAVRGEGKMPPDQPIIQESRSTIRMWIEQGADTTACEPVKRTSKISDNRLFNK
jgi:hypothetical protein